MKFRILRQNKLSLRKFKILGPRTMRTFILKRTVQCRWRNAAPSQELNPYLRSPESDLCKRLTKLTKAPFIFPLRFVIIPTGNFHLPSQSDQSNITSANYIPLHTEF